MATKKVDKVVKPPADSAVADPPAADDPVAVDGPAEDAAAREWLDRELPIGGSRPVAEVQAAAEAAGVSPAALRRAVKELRGISRDGDIWSRRVPRDGDQRQRREETPDEAAAREWLERELPVGASRPVAEVEAAAEAAGIQAVALRRAVKQLRGVNRDGEVWTRNAPKQRASRASEEERAAAAASAREWLDRELPVGASRPVAEVEAAAAAAGVDATALRRVFKQLRGVSRDGDVWTRRQPKEGGKRPRAEGQETANSS